MATKLVSAVVLLAIMASLVPVSVAWAQSPSTSCWQTGAAGQRPCQETGYVNSAPSQSTYPYGCVGNGGFLYPAGSPECNPPAPTPVTGPVTGCWVNGSWYEIHQPQCSSANNVPVPPPTAQPQPVEFWETLYQSTVGDVQILWKRDPGSLSSTSLFMSTTMSGNPVAIPIAFLYVGGSLAYVAYTTQPDAATWGEWIQDGASGLRTWWPQTKWVAYQASQTNATTGQWDHINNPADPRTPARQRALTALAGAGFYNRCLYREDDGATQLFFDGLTPFNAGGKTYSAVSFILNAARPTVMARNSPITDRFYDIRSSDPSCTRAWQFLQNCINGAGLCPAT